MKKAFEYPDREVQKALLAGLGPTESWMIPHLEELLDAPSYELREAALFRLWTAAPASQARHLAQAAGNGSMADPKFRQLWWVLALFTDSYAPLEQRATYLEALRETTAPYYTREVRENGFSLLRQIGALDEQNFRDLIGATVDRDAISEVGLRIGRKIFGSEATRRVSGGSWAIGFFH